MDLNRLRDEVGEWSCRNFGGPTEGGYGALLGVVEEVGELAHSHLKQLQGIRVSEDHEAKIKDAIGDILIYLADYCSVRGIDFETAVHSTWEQVQQRNWKRDPVKGQ